MLVQVSKEERGNKGAAVSSYLSLPGRYCVLMPNSPRAGGVSRKIANHKDRARMRDVVKTLDVPKGMSTILRTAGVSRTKAEIKRDFDYLTRLWTTIRELTMESTAPSMVYEEADLIKRAVRDLYTRDVEEVLVSGDDAYKSAKNFMKLMIPSHAKRVQQYKEENIPLFHRYQAENQIAEIGETQVTLPSGGYLVINPTEALVSIDVNSGRATKGRHIEETALRTNMEAAEEVARQLRLRDLGGLVVIDFIDMEDRRNNGKVERKMRDSLSTDRARIQMGRISSFGLMELSRQRMNPSLTEAQYQVCGDCKGTGRIRTADGTSIMVMRAIEEEGIRDRAAQIIVQVRNEVALYILNHKRKLLGELEERYGFQILLRVDEELGVSDFRVEVSKPSGKDEEAAEDEKSSDNDNRSSSNSSGNSSGSSHRRSNRDDDDNDGDSGRSRRRGRRGGRRRNSERKNEERGDQDSSNQNNQSSDDSKDIDQDQKNNQPKRVRASQKDEASQSDNNSSEVKHSGAKNALGEPDVDEKPKRSRQRKPATAASDKKADENKADKVTSDKKDAPKDDKKEGGKKPSSKSSSAKKPKSTTKEASKASGQDDDKKTEKTPSKAAAKAKTVTKKVSNDDAPKQDPSEYEVVNKTPQKKKKGWWNVLGD